MNEFEDKVIEWSEQQFNVKLHSKESLNLFRTKNGNTFKKLLNFMSETIKSKEDGECIQRFCHSIESKNELKIIGNEIKEIESKTTRIRNQLIAEDFKRKSIEIKDNLNEKKFFVSTLVLNAIEKISAKNKLCTELRPNLKTIKETIGSFEVLFTPLDEFGSENSNSFEKTLNSAESPTNCGQLIDQINQIIENIEYIAYDLSQLEVIQPIGSQIDSQLVSKALTESEPKIAIQEQTKKENDLKNSCIESKLISVQNLMEKYESIRSEKLAKSRDKMEKVINSCDEFIHKKQLKSPEK